jgi:hypothetical protein
MWWAFRKTVLSAESKAVSGQVLCLLSIAVTSDEEFTFTVIAH